jgi:hypothetical protein
MKKNLFLLFFLLCSTSIIKVYSQISLTSYSIYAFGVNTNQDKKLNFEFKVFGNRNINELFLEPTVFYNFKPKEYHKISLGLGANLDMSYNDLLSAVTIPFDVEIMPLQDFKRLSLIIELCPEIYIEDDPSLRCLWGVRYRFGERK